MYRQNVNIALILGQIKLILIILTLFCVQPGGVIISHDGACFWRRNASLHFNRCGGRAVVQDTPPPQTGTFCPRYSCGHHRGQLWTWERSAYCTFHDASLHLKTYSFWVSFHMIGWY